MKDHEIREAINELRDIAIKYRDAQCLREAIAPVVHSIIKKVKESILVPKGSTNKVTLTNPSDYSIPYCKDYDIATVEGGILGEMKGIHQAIADIPDCDCLCENSVEKALLKLQLIKNSKYLATEEDTKWLMP